MTSKKQKVTPARKKALEEYKKQRRRIQQTVSRAKKRGYIFPENIIPPSITELKSKQVLTVSIKKQTRQLKSVTPSNIYAKSEAISRTGQLISGTQKRKEERHWSAVLASANRKAKEEQLEEARKQKEYWSDRERELAQELDRSIEAEVGTEETSLSDFERTEKQWNDEEEQKWQKEQAERDRQNKKRLKEDDTYADQFKQGTIILQNIQQMIEDATLNGTYKQAGMDLSIELSQQLNKYGKDKVVMAIASASQDVIECAQVALNYNPGDERHDSALVELRQLITGEISSAEELKDLEDRIDQDAYTNTTE